MWPSQSQLCRSYIKVNITDLKAIHMKFLALEQENEKKKVLKSVSNFSRRLFAAQARIRIELTFCV
jgi:hypothetical protein